MPGDRNLLSLDTSLAIPTHVLRFEDSRLHRRTPVRPVVLTGQTHWSDRSGTAAAPSSVLALWINQGTQWFSGEPPETPRTRCNLRQSALMTRLPRSPGSTLVLRLNQETFHDFIWLFMPPCGPRLTPLATGSLERSRLVFSTPGGLTGDDLSRLFFTCTNTSQAATCTWNTLPRISPHNVVNHSSHKEATNHRSSNHTLSSFSPLMSSLTTPTQSNKREKKEK
jgi:hypothetical protein